jgi:hypothetical protein
MTSNGILKISEKDLQELIEFSSKKLVGKVMKRFDLYGESNVLKSEVKELVYEGIRDFKDLLIATSYGMGLTQINFKGRENTSLQK